MPVLTVLQPNTQTRIPFEGTPLLRDVLASGGLAVPSPCGGRGTCGKCEVLLLLADGTFDTVRACKTVLTADATVRLQAEQGMQIEMQTKQAEQMPCVCAAVDIGTTTVAVKVFDKDGNCIGHASALNPQRAFGADVIGRIDAALHGKSDALQKLITDCIDDLLAQTGQKDRVQKLVVTGNTAMLYLLTGRSPASIARAPFFMDNAFGETVRLLGLDTYLPPCMDAFVGADITCAVLACAMTERDETALLCDVGTNGELALWKDGTLYVTSAAAGPAFEGAEISSGCMGITGAIDRVYAANGRVYAHTIGDAPAVGICGSGLLDAVAAFLDTEQIDETGAIDGDALVLHANQNAVTLTQGDIRAVQLAKGAIAAAIEVLLAHAGTRAEDIDTVYLAGGFGAKLSPASAVRIGMLPRAFLDKTVPIGNAALSGAVKLLSSDQSIAQGERIARLSRHVELGGSAAFNEMFVEKMMF